MYYLSVGARHHMPWHLALLATIAGGIAANHFWLLDWFAYWWIRAPFQFQGSLLPHRTFHTLWSAPLWGEGADRLLALLTLASAAVGMIALSAELGSCTIAYPPCSFTRRRPAVPSWFAPVSTTPITPAR